MKPKFVFVKQQGSSHPLSKLTAKDVAQMRAMHEQGQSFTAIAKHFGIHNTTVGKICRRQLWRHV